MQTKLYRLCNPYRDRKRSYRLWCAPNDEFVAGWLERGWLFEPQNLHLLANLLKPKSVVLDIGAHIGTYSVFLARNVRGCTVHAFEPQLPLFELLLKNLALNGIENCTPYNLAVAHRQLFTSLQRAVGDGTGAGKALSYEHKGRYNYAGISLGLGRHFAACIAVDQFIEQIKAQRLDLLKVDVEGAEPFVFYGARQAITDFRPIIHFEENYKRVTKELAAALKTKLGSAPARFSIRSYLARRRYSYFRLPFDNVMLLPDERINPALLKHFDEGPSDSAQFGVMYRYKRDRYSPGR